MLRGSASASPRADDTQVQAVPWDMFEAWLRDVWKPGEHVALPFPTGGGKTTFAVGMLKHRRWIVALDPKGGDETLAASGFTPIFTWPPPSKVRDEIAEGKPARLIVSGSVRTDREQEKLIRAMQDTVRGIKAEGNWTLYCDEFQLLADRRMYGLDKPVEELLVAARSRGTSVVTSFQAPAWVPKAATRQASYIVLGPTADEDMVKAVARTGGRDWRQMLAAVKELPEFYMLVIPTRNVRAPMILTKAPAVN